MTKLRSDPTVTPAAATGSMFHVEHRGRRSMHVAANRVGDPPDSGESVRQIAENAACCQTLAMRSRG